MLKLNILAAAITTSAMSAFATDQDLMTGEDRPTLARKSDGDHRSCLAAPSTAQWMRMDQIAASLKERGLSLVKLEARAGCQVARVTAEKGLSLELHLDPVTAEILRRRERI